MLEQLRIDNFKQVYELMEMSFPKVEFRSFQAQYDLLKHDEYAIYTYSDKEGKVMAFIAVWQLTDFLFIEHIAVHKECRNQGLGAKLISELKENSQSLLCLEVELPEDNMSQRRIGFYERNGFKVNPYPYTQPPLRAGDLSIPMYLLTSGKTVDEAYFLKMKAMLYKTVYQYTGSDIEER